MEALKKKPSVLESSKKEAEQVMAQFTIDGPSHPKWACVKNKVCMQNIKRVCMELYLM